jgi:hypothetical protein
MEREGISPPFSLFNQYADSSGRGQPGRSMAFKETTLPQRQPGRLQMFEFALKKTAARYGHKRLEAAIGALAAIVTFLVYLPSLANDFVNWDDQMYVYLNANIRSFDFEFLKWAFRTDMLNAYWHPLTMISYAIDYQILGLNPLQYHLTNGVFHALNTFLVFYLGASLYRSVRPDAPDARVFNAGAAAAGFVSALLFGLHPLHVESVAWISERKDVLYAFFFLLSVLSYLKYARPLAERKALYYSLSLFFFVLSVMSKPMAVTLPLMLLILDWYPLARFSWTGRREMLKVGLLEKLPFFSVSLASGLLTVYSMYGHENVTTGLSLLVRAIVSVRGYIFYIYKMFLPFDLAPVYPYPQKVLLFEFNTIVPAAAFILIGVFCLLTLRRQKVFTAAWLSYLIMLLPVIGIIQNGHQSAADRYTYLPLLGFFFIAGFGAARLADRAGGYLRLIAAVPVLIVFICLSYLTVKQEAVWGGPVSLWSRQIELYPGQPWTAHYFRALGYAKNGEFEKALRDYEIHMASGEFDPKDAVKYVERGSLHIELNDCGAALKDFETALRIKPEFESVVFARPVLEAGGGRCRQAVEGLKGGL